MLLMSAQKVTLCPDKTSFRDIETESAASRNCNWRCYEKPLLTSSMVGCLPKRPMIVCNLCNNTVQLETKFYNEINYNEKVKFDLDFLFCFVFFFFF